MPEGRFGPIEAAEHPLAGDQGIDEHAALRRGRVEALLVFSEERFKLSRIFAGDDLGLGVDAGLQGVEARDGFALLGAWAGGPLGVLTISVDLFECRHINPSWLDGSIRVGGDRVAERR